MSQRILLASIGCSMMIVAGILKLFWRDWEVGLLLIGFALSLWSNVRLQDRLRALTGAASGSPSEQGANLL